MRKLCKQRFAGVRHRRPGLEDQARPDAGRDGQALRQGRARPDLRHERVRRRSSNRAFRLNRDRQAGPRKMAPFSLWRTPVFPFRDSGPMADTAARLYLITPLLDDSPPSRHGSPRPARPACRGRPARFGGADERGLTNLVKALAPAAQEHGAAADRRLRGQGGSRQCGRKGRRRRRPHPRRSGPPARTCASG